MQEPPPTPLLPRWQRRIWMVCGAACLVAGVIGIALPLVSTTPFVLLAAFCFSRGSARYEQWMLNHPRFGPMVRDWRARRAVPLKAKQLAWVMMTLSSVTAWWLLLPAVRWIPGASCSLVAIWLWRLPNR
jgi:uncharacterized membrane protein YbaN (DUF454 family)